MKFIIKNRWRYLFQTCNKRTYTHIHIHAHTVQCTLIHRTHPHTGYRHIQDTHTYIHIHDTLKRTRYKNIQDISHTLWHILFTHRAGQVVSPTKQKPIPDAIHLMSYLSSFPFLHPQPVLCEGTSPGYKSRALAFRQRLQHLVQDSRTDLFRFLGAKKRIKTGRIFQKMEKRVNASSIPCSRCFPTLIGWHTSLRQLPGSTDTPRLLSARRERRHVNLHTRHQWQP